MRKLKPGMKVYLVYADPEDSISISLYVIRTIRKKARKSWQRHTEILMPTMVYMIHKDTHTWVKLSRKNGDWGWSPDIQACSRDSFTLEGYEKRGLPYLYSFTKSGAYYKARQRAIWKLKNIKQELKDNEYDEEDIPEMLDYVKLYEKMISKLKGLHTRTKRKR